MNLTPIKVRGKRKPKPPAAVAASPRITSRKDIDGGSNTSSNNYEDDTLPPPRQKPKRSLSAAIAHRKTSRPRSSIESLPLEILEAILLHCRSFGLPRASSLIGAKLSGKATLFKLFFAAFHDTWEQGFGRPVTLFETNERGGEEILSWVAGRAGDPDFQSEMLLLPWVNIDFLLEAQQVWAERYARDRPYRHWWGKGFIAPAKNHKDEHPPLSFSTPSSSPDSNASEGGCFNARACFEVDYQEALEWPTAIDNYFGTRMPDVHPLTRIPNRLISGPWTEEQRRRLFWLIRAGAAGHTTNRHLPPWETRIACLQNMVIQTTQPEFLVENCFMIIEDLLEDADESWLYKGLPADVAGDEVEQISRRLEWGDDGEETREMLRRTKMYLAGSVERTFWRKTMSRGGHG